MLNVRLAGDPLYGKLLFTWLSLVMSMMVSFCAVLFPTRCLGWDLELNWVSFCGFFFLLFKFYNHKRKHRRERERESPWVHACSITIQRFGCSFRYVALLGDRKGSDQSEPLCNLINLFFFSHIIWDGCTYLRQTLDYRKKCLASSCGGVL